MPGPHDTQSDLEEIDRKLHELQRELARAFERPGAEPEAPPASPPPPSPPDRLDADPPLDPPPTATAPHGSPSGPSQPLAPGLRTQAGGGPAETFPARWPSQPPSSHLQRSDAGRLVEEAAGRVAELGRRIDDLHLLRDALHRSVRALENEIQRGSVADGVASRPEPASPPPGAGAAATFEGAVTVDAGPFFDIATLGIFERSLATIPAVGDVYVRSFEGNRALVDLRLAAPLGLVDEMRRVLPFSLGVVNVAHHGVTLNIDARGTAGFPAGGAPAA